MSISQCGRGRLQDLGVPSKLASLATSDSSNPSAPAVWLGGDRPVEGCPVNVVAAELFRYSRQYL